MTTSGSDTPTVLLVSNRRLDENSGRAAKFSTRADQLADRGWHLEVGYVEPSVTGMPRGIARCLRLAKGADVINSVSNPPQLQIVGGIVARMTNTPWVAEFRDPLVTNPDVDPDSIAAKIRCRLERYILTHADSVVWYDGIQLPDDYFEREYAGTETTTVRKLPPIGFDEEKFDSVEPTTEDAFTVTYAGSFYEGWIEPYTFLDGLGEYVDSLQDSESTAIEAQFYGDWDDEYDRAARSANATDNIETHSFVPHEQIISVMKGSDALLYIGGDDPRNERNLPSKLYDYIGAGRPIIAIVDPSFRVADVITTNGFGLVVEPGDEAGIRDAIEEIRTGEFEYAPSEAAVEKFTRSHSTDAYVDTLESVVDEA